MNEEKLKEIVLERKKESDYADELIGFKTSRKNKAAQILNTIGYPARSFLMIKIMQEKDIKDPYLLKANCEKYIYDLI